MIYYIGLRESDILDAGIFNSGSITYFGSNKNGNHSLNGEMKRAINHNDIKMNYIFNNFLKSQIEKIKAKDKDAKFYCYNQGFIGEQKKIVDFDTICNNPSSIVDKLNDKFFTRELLKDTAKMVEYKKMKGSDISLLKLAKVFDGGKNFVVQGCMGNGGESTYLLNSKTEAIVLPQIDAKTYYHVSKYLTSNSINTHIVIGDKDIVIFPSSVQIIIPKDNKLCYCGGDFSAYSSFITKAIDNKVNKYSLAIAKKIKELGYKGVLGIDYIATKDEVYFMEINPRFQTSSGLLNMNLRANNLPSLHKINLDAFEGKRLSQLPKFKATGSFLVRTYNDGLSFNVKPVKIFNDGNKNSEQIEPGTYTQIELFEKAITNDFTQYDEDEVFKTKLELMQNGIKIEDNTMKALDGALYNDYVTCSGVMLKLGGGHSAIMSNNLDDVYLNKREYVTAGLNAKSKYTLTTADNGDFILLKNGKLFSQDISISRPMLEQNERSCVAIHGDRIRVSLITGCSGDCRFCGLNKLPYTPNNFETIKTEIDKLLSLKKGITRLFITGGNPKESDLKGTLITLEKIIKEYTPRGIKKYDFMFAPRGIDKYFYDKDQNKEYDKFLLKLKQLGVTTVAIDMEMYNSNLLKKYAPFKSKIGRDNYLYVLKKSVEIFGKDNVRSNIIVGIEPLEDTIKAVKAIIAVNAQPCLSPYEPYKLLPEVRQPSWEFLYAAFKETEKNCLNTNTKMAPSIYATDTHNSVASALDIPLTRTEYESCYNNINAVIKSVQEELNLKKIKK